MPTVIAFPLLTECRWWKVPHISGIIRYFDEGFWKYVRPDEDLSEYTIVRDDTTGAFTFYNPRREIMCVEYAESYFVDNGYGCGYTFYYPNGTSPGVGALEIQDRYDGERDIIYGGQPPSEDWTIQPVANRQTLQLRSSARTATKDLNRVQVPFSQGVGLFYHLNALEDPRQMYVILAGPSVFSPECLGRYGLLNRQIINGTLSDTDMPANWNVIVDRISLEKLQTCVRTHNKDLFWTSKAGYVYPMMSIAPDGWFSWTPRILSSWIPPNKLREFLDNYEFKNGDRTDPRIPRRFWPNGVNFSFPGPLKVAIPRQ